MEIKILGPGCAKCNKTVDVVNEAAVEAGVSPDIKKITDTMEIASYGIFGTPAVIVDGEAKSVGKVPSKDEVIGWLK